MAQEAQEALVVDFALEVVVPVACHHLVNHLMGSVLTDHSLEEQEVQVDHHLLSLKHVHLRECSVA